MRGYVIAAFLLIGGCQYVSRHYKLEDTLAWAKKNPGSPHAPKINYYVGMIYYGRADYPGAQTAFMQLLQDHATSQYVGKALVRLEDAAEGNHDFDAARMAVDRYLELHDEQFPTDKNLELMRQRSEQLKMRGK